MKILIATKKTQGQRTNDFFWTNHGEALQFGFVCGKDEQTPDGPCGCNRSMCGLYTGAATTTMEVADATFDRAGFEKMIVDYLHKNWSMPAVKAVPEAAKMARVICAEANRHEIGTVLEYRAGRFAARKTETT